MTVLEEQLRQSGFSREEVDFRQWLEIMYVNFLFRLVLTSFNISPRPCFTKLGLWPYLALNCYCYSERHGASSFGYMSVDMVHQSCLQGALCLRLHCYRTVHNSLKEGEWFCSLCLGADSAWNRKTTCT